MEEAGEEGSYELLDEFLQTSYELVPYVRKSLEESIFLRPQPRPWNTSVIVENPRQVTRVPGFAITDPFRTPWPSTPVLSTSERCLEFLDAGEKACVSEKLDGSCIALVSNGLVFSRRTLLLNNPTSEELRRKKFLKTSLDRLEGPLQSVRELAQELTFDWFEGKKVTAIVYGELITSTTAAGDMNRYRYKERGYRPGDFYVFGLGIQISEYPEIVIDKFKDELGLEMRFIRQKLDQSNDEYFITGMNVRLEFFLRIRNFSVAPTYDMPFSHVFEAYASALVTPNYTEGIIITIPSRGAIFKWKGLEDLYHRRRIKGLNDQRLMISDWPRVLRTIMGVAQASVKERTKRVEAKQKSVRLDIAWRYAASKYPYLSEQIEMEENKSPEDVVREYHATICEEMRTDEDLEDEYKEGIDEYVSKRIERIRNENLDL